MHGLNDAVLAVQFCLHEYLINVTKASASQFDECFLMYVNRTTNECTGLVTTHAEDRKPERNRNDWTYDVTGW